MMDADTQVEVQGNSERFLGMGIARLAGISM